MKKRERAKRGVGRWGSGKGGTLGKEHWAARESGGEGEGDYRRGIAAREGEEINKRAKIERGEGMLGLGARLEALCNFCPSEREG